MPLSWNEIRDRAIRFSREWAEATSEKAEAQTFLNEFFEIFGVSRRRVASFERRVSKADGKGSAQGSIDLLWKSHLLVEFKSAGKDLDAAYKQAVDYFPGLKEVELPRYILVCDFHRFRVHDLEKDATHAFNLKDLPRHIHLFGFMAGYESRPVREEDPVNVLAVERMGRLHDELAQGGYTGHDLEVLLVRLVFCLFAEDTGIFEPDSFTDFIVEHSAEDFTNLGGRLNDLFEVLNTPEEKRLKNLSERLAAFPFVNGRLFEERLRMAAFDRSMCNRLTECCGLDWSGISPAVFGSLFQSVMNPGQRRAFGAHYTREANIMKLIGPLFMGDLRAEFERIKSNKKKLEEFHARLRTLTFLDPACGCGNFLVIAYRELRLLDLDVLRALKRGQRVLGQRGFDESIPDVDQFYGIEIEEFPAQIAQTALWMMDHQMNMRYAAEFGEPMRRIPLHTSPTIRHANALRMEWSEMIPKERLHFILGNPPFVGKQYQSTAQKADMALVFEGRTGTKELDYVSAWYLQSARLMRGTGIRCAFVSTNSIVQGEQVGVLWGILGETGIRIHFAHRTFQWTSEARKAAAVHVVIVGFGAADRPDKVIYDYDELKGEPHAIPAANINPYLADAPDLLLNNRREPLCEVPPIVFGSMANDGGHLLLTNEEKAELVRKEPEAAPWIKRFVGAEEFINNIPRWCLWLRDMPPEQLARLPEVRQRVNAVRKHREASKRAATQKLAGNAMRFGEDRQPDSKYLILPRVSSERRDFIPMAFAPKSLIASDRCQMIPRASLYHFGVLSSTMHMAWTRAVAGRLKSDYSYSNEIVYNNFPWPMSPAPEKARKVEEAAQAVLDAREQFPKANLAQLYDPLSMPPVLLKAHQALDRAVDACYGAKGMASDMARVSFLFDLYGKYTGTLPLNGSSARPRRRAVRKA